MISLFKRWLSYFWDIEVAYRSSEYNPDLIVFLSQGRYQLCTNNAIYSHEDKYFNFTEVLRNHVDYDRLLGNRVLVLGLGLGSIPIILDQIAPGTWDITAVEIDEEIIDLARIYGYPKITSQMHTISADAAAYVQICSQSYDLICVDVFVGEHTPQKFRTTDFLDRLASLTAPGGIVIYNTLAFTPEDRNVSREFFDQIFKRTFVDAQCINAHRNYMLLSY